MSDELERTENAPDAARYADMFQKRRAELEPYQDAAPWYAGPALTERPEWTELRPPYHPDSELEHTWSVVLTPLRAIALGLLWLTYAWYRFAIALGAVLVWWTAIHS